MKKNIMMRVASALLIAVLMSTCVISGTFAKYTTSATGDDSARVAKWHIKVGSFDTATSTEKTFTFNLFNTIYDTNKVNSVETDGDVGSDNSTVLIAPGTWGYFDLVITNESEVNAEYSLTLTETMESAPSGATSPIYYKVETLTTQGAPSAPPTVNGVDGVGGMSKASGGTITVADGVAKAALTMTNKTVTIRIYWLWEFATADTSTDATDTALGLDGDTQIKVTAAVTVTQVD